MENWLRSYLSSLEDLSETFRIVSAYGNIHFVMSQEKLLGYLLRISSPLTPIPGFFLRRLKEEIFLGKIYL